MSLVDQDLTSETGRNGKGTFRGTWYRGQVGDKTQRQRTEDWWYDRTETQGRTIRGRNPGQSYCVKRKDSVRNRGEHQRGMTCSVFS